MRVQENVAPPFAALPHGGHERRRGGLLEDAVVGRGHRRRARGVRRRRARHRQVDPKPARRQRSPRPRRHGGGVPRGDELFDRQRAAGRDRRRRRDLGHAGAQAVHQRAAAREHVVDGAAVAVAHARQRQGVLLRAVPALPERAPGARKARAPEGAAHPAQ
ncbi:MAG: hypothetical protein CL844_03555 [Crocinitomicaceae bacterium]|nr:hypothetical protein [Crocinitomicaceae bacterium]